MASLNNTSLKMLWMVTVPWIVSATVRSYTTFFAENVKAWLAWGFNTDATDGLIEGRVRQTSYFTFRTAQLAGYWLIVRSNFVGLMSIVDVLKDTIKSFVRDDEILNYFSIKDFMNFSELYVFYFFKNFSYNSLKITLY